MWQCVSLGVSLCVSVCVCMYVVRVVALIMNGWVLGGDDNYSGGLAAKGNRLSGDPGTAGVPASRLFPAVIRLSRLSGFPGTSRSPCHIRSPIFPKTSVLSYAFFFEILVLLFAYLNFVLLSSILIPSSTPKTLYACSHFFNVSSLIKPIVAAVSKIP